MKTRVPPEELNRKLTAYLTQAIKDLYEQSKGVRVISMEVTPEPLNPPGLSFNIRAHAQITFGVEKEETPTTQ